MPPAALEIEQARREQIAFACERGLSKRRACGLLGVSRSSLSHQLRLPAEDAPVIEAMKKLSAQYPRLGYRRIRIFLRRQGPPAWLASHASPVAPGGAAAAAPVAEEHER